MASFVPIEDDQGNQIYYIEVIPTGSQSGIKQTSKDSGVADKLTANDLKRMIRQAVMPTCQTFVDVWQELNQPLTAESAEVEFNLGFTASGNAVIMQASGQASFKVKVNWKFVSANDSSHLVNVDDDQRRLVGTPRSVGVGDDDPSLVPPPPPVNEKRREISD
jgi:hypothetical protein